MSLSTKDTYSRSMPTGGETPVQVLKKEEKNEDSFFLPQAEVPVPPAQAERVGVGFDGEAGWDDESLYVPRAEASVPRAEAEDGVGVGGEVERGKTDGSRGVKREREEEEADEAGHGTPTPSFAPLKRARKTTGLVRKEVVDTRPSNQNPGWFKPSAALQKQPRGDSIALRRVVQLHQKVVMAAYAQQSLVPAIGEVRRQLLKMSVMETTPHAIQQSRLVTDDTFPLIYEESMALHYHYPSDVRDIARSLHSRWYNGDTDGHLLRGIITTKGTNSKQRTFRFHALDPNYPFSVNCNYFGAGNLYNGQWFPLQIAAKRDGAHGDIEAGIHGQKGKGAYSIVVSGSGYANIDNGLTLQYCGTQGTKDAPTANTKLMLLSHRNQTPIRVLRSSNLPQSNKYRPSIGLRYDGLYLIDDFELLNPQKATYRFNMTRVAGQSYIRCTGDSRRPGPEEVEAHRKIWDLLDGRVRGG